MVKRASVIEKFIECMRVSLSLSHWLLNASDAHVQHLSDLHDYNTLLAVVGGLNHFSIRRLTQTWAKVDKPKREVRLTSFTHPPVSLCVQELELKTEFFSSNSNFSTYRQAVAGLDKVFHMPML